MAAVQTVAPNSAGESSAAALNWLVCCAGSYLCALPLAQVIETMRPLPIEYLAHTPAFVRGVSVIRGAPVPIVDIGILFGEAASRTGRLVTIKVGDGNQVALAVGDVLGIRSIPPADTGAMPSLLRDTDEGIVSTIGVLDANLLHFLKTALLVPDQVWQALARHGATP